MTRFTSIAAGIRVARGAVLTMVTCALLSACGSSSSTTSPPTGSTTLIGVVADATENGSLTVTVASGTLALALPSSSKFAFFNFVTPAYAASVVTATGTLSIQGGAKITLSGTYDTGTHALSLTGGGYTFTGTYSNGELSGTFTNPQGNAGNFSTQSGTTASVVVYCGTYAGSDVGYWNMVINLTTHVGSGIHVSTVAGHAGGSLTGTVSGSSISGTSTGPGGGTFAGTFSGASQGTLSGTWTGTGAGGGSGTFTGGLCT